MAQSNIVFLIDVNSIPKRQPRPPADDQKARGDSTETGYNDSSSTELIPPAQTGTFGIPNIQWLKEIILINLCKEANNGSGYDFGKVRWTFKFFDTSRHIDNRDGRSFSPFDTDSISHFENQVDQIVSTLATNETTQSDVQVPYGTGIKFLADAIKTITGTLQWTTEPEFQMFEMSRSFSESENPEHPPDRNKVFVFFNVPRTESDLLEFAGPSSSTKEFMGMLLPQAFSQIFHYKLRAQLNFVDMLTAHYPDEKWKGPYPKLLIKCLTYLGHGQISHLQPRKLESMNKIATDQGLIPYTVFLRTCLRDSVAVTQNENVLSRIKHLIPANPKSAQKVSPDLDSSSVCRKSSVLDSSMNSQSKTIRPFHMTSGYDGGSDNLEFYQRRMANIKEQDRLREREREGERKRKRFEYEDDYDKQGRSRHHLIDDRDYGSNDADSEKEHNRLESWINDSNDDYLSKRKRHSDATSSAVPMSRAGLNKSFHVFHEPAPKLPGSSSRGTKMLATVERQKIKVSVVESKRRSTEGLDLKRIAQQQEIELRAVKRRLKLHLHGEIDDDEDPIKWMKTLKVQLGSFIDFNLQDEKPCLVALAQALVNHTSHNFPLHRLSAMKTAYRNKSLTIKELLEDILLIDFTKLNKKIITAHENNGRKESMENLSFIKNLCFREVELQIILRLEIAWCFAQPDEDVTADVLTDIVRLLQIISAYRTRPPISNFMNSVLLPAYRQSSRFMRELYKRMNAPLPAQLAIDGSPIAGTSARDDDASIISSTSSANLYPEDSASQLQMHRPRKVRNSPVYNRMSMRSTNYKNPAKTGRNAKSEPKRVKRQILIGNSNPKQTSQHALDKNNSQKSSGGNLKVSPKRVRRNLFDVQKQDKKDSKLLLALSSSSRVTRSPVFKSPKGKSPSSGSGFFRAVRSRRQLVMNSESPNQHFGSPQINPAEVLCPESPATPHSVSSRYTGTNISGGSAERQRIIQESPEITKNEYEDRPMRKVASLSFYSRGVNGEAVKSRAWEKSETKLLAARIKDSVDLRTRDNKELTLNDLEFIQKYPTPTHNTSGLTDTPNTSLSFCANSVEGSPMHPSTDSPLLQHFTGPAPDLDNPNIEALIKSENFRFPLNSDVALKPPQRESIGSPAATATTAVDSPGAYHTPSKRVQFNLNENLINTPSSSKHSSSGTPKSILKEAQEGK